MSNDKKYFHDYYEKNKKKIAAKRRKKYREDATYREQLKERSRQATQRRRKVGRMVPEFMLDDTKFDGRRMKLIPVGKSSVCVYLGKLLADAIGVTTMTISLWNKEGVIPPPSFQGSDGRRWYTKPYIELMRNCVRQHYRGLYRLEDFKELTWAEYKKIQGDEERVRSAA